MPGPQYPVYASTPYTGDLPSQFNMGPPDLYPSSSTGPYYQERFDNMYGRHLAGVEKPVGSDDEPAYALNELRLMQELDDVDSNGVFDPPGSRPNIYPDAGVFASSYAQPGYLARERMYAPSEVVDANTGRPVVYVNGGLVSMDSTAEIAFMEAGNYPKPIPYLDMYSERRMPRESTVNVVQNPVPVRTSGPPSVMSQGPLPPVPNAANSGATAGLGSDSPSLGKLALTLGIVGLGAGVVWAATKPAFTSNKRRRRR